MSFFFSHLDDEIRIREKEISTIEMSEKTSTNLSDRPKIEIPEDAFLMVTQMNWEDDVVWNGEDIKHKVNI